MNRTPDLVVELDSALAQTGSWGSRVDLVVATGVWSRAEVRAPRSKIERRIDSNLRTHVPSALISNSVASVDRAEEDRTFSILASIDETVTDDEVDRIALLEETLTHDDVPEVRAASAAGLGRCAGASSVSALVNALSDQSAPVRRASAIALGRLGYRAAVPELATALHNDESVCREAAAALGAIGSSEALLVLYTTLRSADLKPAVRARAAVAIGGINAGDDSTQCLDELDPWYQDGRGAVHVLI